MKRENIRNQQGFADMCFGEGLFLERVIRMFYGAYTHASPRQHTKSPLQNYKRNGY